MSKHGNERFRTGLWSKADVNWTHLINQSMTLSSRKNSGLPKNVPEADPTITRYLSCRITQDRRFNKLILFLLILFRRRRYGIWGQVGNLKSSHFDLHRFNAISDLSCEFFFYGLAAFDYLFFHFNSMTHPPAILICFQN